MANLKDPTQALAELKDLQQKLWALDGYLFSEVHAADNDFETGLVDTLIEAQSKANKCMYLLERLIERNAAAKSLLGCKVKEISHAA